MIISMYARGMTVLEIRGHLEEIYGIDVSAVLISAVTDTVLEEVAEWWVRPKVERHSTSDPLILHLPHSHAT